MALPGPTPSLGRQLLPTAPYQGHYYNHSYEGDGENWGLGWSWRRRRRRWRKSTVLERREVECKEEGRGREGGGDEDIGGKDKR